MALKLLVVDDDSLVLESVKLALPEPWDMEAYNSPDDVPEDRFYHAALIDMHLTGNHDRAEGLDLIKKLNRLDSHMELIAMSGNLDRDLMEKCLKAGATRYLAKPLSVEEIVLTLGKIEALYLLQGATQRINKNNISWVGNGPRSADIKRKIASLRGEQGPILISGESGTGKEVCAQLIHDQDCNGPYIRVNIAAIPEGLFESELFGHVRGAFTGADQNKMGLAEAAHGGDLFLDEIEALALPLQVKLLRFLESGEVRRVGSKDSQMVKVRVIVATNRSLQQMVSTGEFREDLLFRLSGQPIDLPPLRERPEDIAELCKSFLGRDLARRKELSSDAIEALCEYNWPGNVRELKRVCEQLTIMAPLPIIRREDVTSILKPSSPTLSGEKIDFSRGLADLINEFEARVIAKCLYQYDDVDEVGRLLKVSRSSLYKKIKDHGIEWRQ